MTIKRVAKSFNDLNTTLKLAVSGDKAPDVVQANQGRQVMGQLVKGGLLRRSTPTRTPTAGGDRWSTTLLDLNRFSDDGKEFGTGSLFGVSQMGEIVGVFYNKDKVASPPKTFAEFEQKLAKAKPDGDVPISFGNLDQFARHPRVPDRAEPVRRQGGGPRLRVRQERRVVRHAGERGGRHEAPGVGEEGLLHARLQRHGLRPRLAAVRQGQGAVPDRRHVADRRPRRQHGRQGRLHADAARRKERPPVSLGGESLPFAVTPKSKNPDVAAAYIDFLTTAEAGQVLVDTNNLPAMKTDAQPRAALSQEVVAAWKTLNDEEGLCPYIDYATPTFYDDISGAIQKLLAGQAAAGRVHRGRRRRSTRSSPTRS